MNKFFSAAQTQVLLSCPDPKGFGPNLDADLTAEDKNKIVLSLQFAARHASNAIAAAARSDDKAAIESWVSVFGSDFPKYGS